MNSNIYRTALAAMRKYAADNGLQTPPPITPTQHGMAPKPSGAAYGQVRQAAQQNPLGRAMGNPTGLSVVPSTTASQVGVPKPVGPEFSSTGANLPDIRYATALGIYERQNPTGLAHVNQDMVLHGPAIRNGY